MENQSPEIRQDTGLREPSVDPVQAPEVTEKPVNRPFLPLFTLPIGIGGIIIIFLATFALSGLFRVKTGPPAINVPTGIPEPSVPDVPVTRELHPLATGSAFLNFESGLASFSAQIKVNNGETGIVSPPVLEMSLGFQSE